MLKHWPLPFFLVASFLGLFAPFHEFLHLVCYFMETGNIGEMTWFTATVTGGLEWTYGGPALIQSVLYGVMFIYGNRWLKYISFSEIMIIVVFWYSSWDFQRVWSPFMEHAPMVICITAILIGLIKVIRGVQYGQRRADQIYIQ